MLRIDRTVSGSLPSAAAPPRRVLVCAETEAAHALAAELDAAGYETILAAPDEAAGRAAEFAPHVALVEIGEAARAADALKLARGLREDERLRSLPLAFVYGGDGGEARAAAVELGADDCFRVSCPRLETLARLDALFWRVEAGRGAADARAADAARGRRAEIDDFLQLLEAARALAANAAPFTLALLAPRPADGDATARHDADAAELGGARDFFRLNLRRRDSVAFYGPTLLAALLPCGRARRPADDLARLLAEFHDAHPHARLAAGLASFPADAADIESLVVRAEAALDRVGASIAPAEESNYSSDESADPADGPTDPAVKSNGPGEGTRKTTEATRAAGDEATHGSAAEAARASAEGVSSAEEMSSAEQMSRRPAQEFLPLDGSGARASGEWRVPAQSHAGEQSSSARASAKRGLPADFPSKRVLRESKGDDYGSAWLPSFADAGAGGVLARAASEAAARERARRARGAAMPRRLLLAVSDAARMAQVNLLLRSAAYEVRAAFDGKQVLDLLRIERADVLVLDFALAGLDGLEVLRRLDERHGGRLPLPVVLLVPAESDGEELRASAARHGAGGFVPLPYDPQDLLDRVRTAGGKE